MSQWIIALIEAGGYWGIMLLMAIENIFPPIPSEVIMGVGGLAVARGTMQFVPLLIAGTVGSALGNYVLFRVADQLGYERLKPMVDKWGRWITLEWQDIERGSQIFRKRGGMIVFVLRFMPMFRSVVSLPAGLAHMGHIRFLLYTAAGAAIWNAMLICAGTWASKQFAELENWIGWIAGGVAVIAIVYYIYRVITWHPRERD